ncbi:MAG: ATP-binding protein, partial [Cyanobacteria bacterium P01_A01_bin.135]
DAVDLEFLQEDLPKTMGSIQVGAERIRNIVRSLQRFARSDDSAAAPVNLHDGLDNTLMILQHRLRANAKGPEIALVKQYGDLPPVSCQAGRINQVFMNVLSNAIEALEEQYQRQLGREALSPQDGRPRHLLPHHQGKLTLITSAEAGKATIRIIDNGPGMSTDVKARLFDPFFTTKPVGKGTGLGLSISHRIIVAHQGCIDYISTPGQGTECRITLPVHSRLPLA